MFALSQNLDNNAISHNSKVATFPEELRALDGEQKLSNQYTGASYGAGAPIAAPCNAIVGNAEVHQGEQPLGMAFEDNYQQ